MLHHLCWRDLGDINALSSAGLCALANGATCLAADGGLCFIQRRDRGTRFTGHPYPAAQVPAWYMQRWLCEARFLESSHS